MKKFLTTDYGLLFLRMGIGVMFVLHGFPKIMQGPEKWSKLGKSISHIGIDFFPMFWGFMASASELFGGLFLILGVFFAPSCTLLLITMMVASMHHISQGDSFPKSSHAIEAAILFFSLLITGPGKYTLQTLFKK